jgi:drug/metabolite transporter (DMT)-like permease
VNPWLLIPCLASQVCLVSGQICLKHATNLAAREGGVRRRVVAAFAMGIAALTLWFFLWVGLLQRLNLSYLYPFEGLSPVLLLVGAAIFLREKLTLRTCLGIALISAGLALVSTS